MSTEDALPILAEDRAALIEARRHELAVREKDIERQAKKDQLDHAFAMASLEKQGTAVAQAHSSGKWLIGWLIAIVFALIAAATTLVWLGHKDFVMEGFKFGAAFLMGGAGGWGARASKGDSPQ